VAAEKERTLIHGTHCLKKKLDSEVLHFLFLRSFEFILQIWISKDLELFDISCYSLARPELN